MIAGTGVDSVAIDRFAQWHLYNHKKLARIFNEPEIEYCLSNPALSAQRFAVRFAAREAFFKAISAHRPDHSIPFLTLCRATTIIKNKASFMKIDWKMLVPYGITGQEIKIHLSLTHTNQLATAFIILESL